MADLAGIEPATSCLQDRRSPNGVVTLSQTERNLPTTANVDARDFKHLACWLIVQIGPISLNVTTPGVKHCSMNILYSLQHLGYVIPPQADAGWIGEAGPGPSYLDEGSGGPQNEFTQRNVTFMTWNLMHLARMLKETGGIPAHGNQRSEWDAGCRFDHPNPLYR